jgi:hypothetical protein
VGALAGGSPVTGTFDAGLNQITAQSGGGGLMPERGRITERVATAAQIPMRRSGVGHSPRFQLALTDWFPDIN